MLVVTNICHVKSFVATKYFVATEFCCDKNVPTNDTNLMEGFGAVNVRQWTGVFCFDFHFFWVQPYWFASYQWRGGKVTSWCRDWCAWLPHMLATLLTSQACSKWRHSGSSVHHFQTSVFDKLDYKISWGKKMLVLLLVFFCFFNYFFG